MQYKTRRNLRALYMIFFVFLHSVTLGHGFAPDTLVQLSNGSWQNIHTLCLRSLHNKVSVASHNTDTDYNTNQWVKLGKKSHSNCYIRLGFDPDFNDTSHNDITCTPMQEFYIPKTHQWVPAYMLKIGNALLTKDMVAKPITYIQFIPEPLAIYTLEIEESHTFFVGKHSILTHNIFLPIAFNIGLSLPFGSVAAGTAGSFFGPIGVACGIVLGGIIGLTIKAIYENQIPTYKTPAYDIPSIKSTCFTPDHEINTIHTHITPIENPLPKTAVGCIEIEIELVPDKIPKGCYKNEELQKTNVNGCFEPIQQNEQQLFNTQEKISEPQNTKIPYEGQKKAHNWKEFKDNFPIGQKHDDKFANTGKQNPKDKAPIYKVLEDIPDTEMLKKGNRIAIDRLHADHFEVWDKKGDWIGVANFDGSKNHAKTNAETNRDFRNIKNII